MKRHQQAQGNAGHPVRVDPPLIVVDFWNVPALYVRTLDATGWDALLQDQRQFRRIYEVLDRMICDLSRTQAQLEGRPFGRLPQTLGRSRA